MKWYRAREELPTDGGLYLVRCVYSACVEPCVAYLNDGDEWVENFTNKVIPAQITHWAEIPEIKQ